MPCWLTIDTAYQPVWAALPDTLSLAHLPTTRRYRSTREPLILAPRSDINKLRLSLIDGSNVAKEWNQQVRLRFKVFFPVGFQQSIVDLNQGVAGFPAPDFICMADVMSESEVVLVSHIFVGS